MLSFAITLVSASNDDMSWSTLIKFSPNLKLNEYIKSGGNDAWKLIFLFFHDYYHLISSPIRSSTPLLHSKYYFCNKLVSKIIGNQVVIVFSDDDSVQLLVQWNVQNWWFREYKRAEKLKLTPDLSLQRGKHPLIATLNDSWICVSPLENKQNFYISKSICLR
jgi:hypothetical protein